MPFTTSLFTFFAVLNSAIFYLYGDANIMLISHSQSLYMASFKTWMYATKWRNILPTLTSTKYGQSKWRRQCVSSYFFTQLSKHRWKVYSKLMWKLYKTFQSIYFPHVKHRILGKLGSLSSHVRTYMSQLLGDRHSVFMYHGITFFTGKKLHDFCLAKKVVVFHICHSLLFSVSDISDILYKLRSWPKYNVYSKYTPFVRTND